MKKIILCVIVILGIYVIAKGLSYRRLPYFVDSPIPATADTIQCKYTKGSAFSFDFLQPNYQNEGALNQTIMNWFLNSNSEREYQNTSTFDCGNDPGCTFKFSGLTTNQPKITGNMGEEGVQIIESGASELVILESLPLSYQNIFRIRRDSGLIIGTKSISALGTPAGVLYLGQCTVQ